MHRRILWILAIAIPLACFAAGTALAGTPNTGSFDVEQSVNSARAASELSRDSANLEALINIIANSFEILAFTAGGEFLWGAIAAVLRKRGSIAKLFFSLTIIYPILGLATPGVINWITVSCGESYLWFVLAAVAAVGILGVLLLIFWTFLPSFIAFRDSHPKRNWVLLGNFFAWLPFCWPILIYVALGHNSSVNETWTQTIRRFASRTTLWKAGIVLFVVMGILGAVWSLLFTPYQ